MPDHKTITGDCLEVMRAMEPNSVDLVFTSPPYEDARTYGIGFRAKGDAWVDWCVPRVMECLRVSKGLACWVVEGRTRNYRYSNAPMRLAVAVENAGGVPRKPPVYNRVGIPGSGGPDWLRNDYEFVLSWTREAGKLPWSDNVAMGHPPKFGPGGPPSHRLANGLRVNGNRITRRNPDCSRSTHVYKVPAKSNPGNIVRCKAGGWVMGSRIAHENEAPFPESLAEFFIKSFCPEGGTVLDPFGGSGTVAAVCEKLGRNSISIDIRESQTELQRRRIEEAKAKGRESAE
jgi:hypothetical protein